MSTTSESRQSHTQEESVHMTDRTSVQTGVTCPHPGSYMVEIFGISVRTGIAHKVILTSQFVRTGIVPQLGYARVLSLLAASTVLPACSDLLLDITPTKTTIGSPDHPIITNTSQIRAHKSLQWQLQQVRPLFLVCHASPLWFRHYWSH